MDGSLGKVLALEALRPEFSPQHPIKLPGVVACARNPSAMETRDTRIPGQFTQRNW